MVHWYWGIIAGVAFDPPPPHSESLYHTQILRLTCPRPSVSRVVVSHRGVIVDCLPRAALRPAQSHSHSHGHLK